jgi:hypothetical protein
MVGPVYLSYGWTRGNLSVLWGEGELQPAYGATPRTRYSEHLVHTFIVSHDSLTCSSSLQYLMLASDAPDSTRDTQEAAWIIHKPCPLGPWLVDGLHLTCPKDLPSPASVNELHTCSQGWSNY